MFKSRIVILFLLIMLMIGAFFTSRYTLGLFMCSARPQQSINDPAVHEKMGSIMVETLCDGFCEGIFCTNKKEFLKKSQNSDLYKKEYEKRKSLNLSSEHDQLFFDILVNRIYFPAIESGFRARMIMNENSTLKDLDFEKLKIGHNLGIIIGHWIVKNPKDLSNAKAIINNLPQYVVDNFSISL